MQESFSHYKNEDPCFLTVPFVEGGCCSGNQETCVRHVLVEAASVKRHVPTRCVFELEGEHLASFLTCLKSMLPHAGWGGACF